MNQSVQFDARNGLDVESMAARICGFGRAGAPDDLLCVTVLLPQDQQCDFVVRANESVEVVAEKLKAAAEKARPAQEWSVPAAKVEVSATANTEFEAAPASVEQAAPQGADTPEEDSEDEEADEEAEEEVVPDGQEKAVPRRGRRK